MLFSTFKSPTCQKIFGRFLASCASGFLQADTGCHLFEKRDCNPTLDCVYNIESSMLAAFHMEDILWHGG